MKKNKISHGDLTLDNIGFDLNKNTYLLYDFETIEFDSEQDGDLYTFLKSINFRLGA
jgi:tRNA A-37 threonylcarbamoyl transferase component Bud32